MQRHIVSSIACLLLLICIQLPPTAAATSAEDGIHVSAGLNLTAAEQQALQQLGTIRVPVIDHQPPLSYLENGIAKGYLNELLTLVLKQLGLHATRIETSFADSLKLLQHSDVSLLNSYSPSENRSHYLFESKSVLTTPFVTVARRGTATVRSISDLTGSKLVLVSDFFQTRFIQENYPHLDVLLVENIEQAYSALRTRDADFYIDNAIHAGYYLQHFMVSDLLVVGQLPSNEIDLLNFHFAVSKRHPLLFSAVEKALASIDDSTLLALRSKWLQQQRNPNAYSLTTDEVAWLKAHPVIQVAIDPDWAPVEFRGENGELRGMSSDYLRLLGERLNVTFEPVLDHTWQEVVQGVKDKRMDMFASVARTPDRENYTIFTEPYVSMPIKIFGHENNAYVGELESLRGKRVAVVEAYAVEEWIRADFPGLDLVPVETPLKGLQLAERDPSVVFVGNVVTSNYYIRKHGVENLRILGDTPFKNDQAMAVRNDWPLLASSLQKALKSIPAHEHKAIMNRWMTVEFQREMDYRLLWQILLAGCIVVAIFFYWNRRLATEISHRRFAEQKLREHHTQLEQRVEQRANELLESEKRFQQFFFQNSSVMLLIEPESGEIVEANQAAIAFYGYAGNELMGMTIDQINTLPPEEVAKERDNALKEKRNYFNFRHRLADGEISDVEVYSTPFVVNDRTLLFSIVHDITERKLAHNLTQLRNQLSELVYDGDLEQVMQAALDAAERLTDSEIGFFRLMNTDQSQTILQCWSTNTHRAINGDAELEQTSCPVSGASVCADAIRERQPLIENDCMNLAPEHRLLQGHSALTRQLVVPSFQGERIVTVIAVANKPRNYIQRDIEVLARIAEIATDFISRKQAEDRIEHMAYHDTLTDLPNRALLSDRLEQAMATHKQNNLLMAVCFIDLDNFKPINDRYGHETGDKLLVHLAQRIKSQLRDGDTVGRLGGDEFICLLTNLSTVHEAELALQRILADIDKPFKIGGISFDISSSTGMTLYPLDDVSSDSLIRHADQAMLEAKAKGRGDYCLYDMVEGKKHSAHRKTLNEIVASLERDEFVLFYQPRVDLIKGEAVGVEALIRWQHPQEGLLGPGAFLPYLDGQYEEIILGEWVVRTALAQHAKWLEQGLRLPISINISPLHIQQPGFVAFLAGELDKYPAGTARHIELEVLETAAIGDTQQVSETMKHCKELGIIFSLDDFGTGYSSLTHFHRLPIDILKIDQNFVRNMLDDASNLDIVVGVIRLAEALGRPVVAEGVESLELGQKLFDFGCRYAQGFGISRPMPADNVIPWLASWEQNTEWKAFAATAPVT